MEKWAFFNFDPLNWQAILPTYIMKRSVLLNTFLSKIFENLHIVFGMQLVYDSLISLQKWITFISLIILIQKFDSKLYFFCQLV